MLYDLVVLKKSLLEGYDTAGVTAELARLQDRLESVKLQVPVIEQENLDYLNSLITVYSNLIDQVAATHMDFDHRIKSIEDKITKESHKLFANSYELEERDGGFEHIRNHRRIHIRNEVEETVQQRIQLYTNWRYPTLEIGCRDGEWTQYLVAADPLYVIDKYQEFLDSTNNRFPDEYKKRLRKYQLKNYDFSALPQEQFGFVFSWGHFNYVSLDTITQVLKSVMNLLRPGGVFLFSYNDGDTPAGAGMAENFAQSYIPQSILIPTCLALGYEVVEKFNEEPNISWIEIKKPGVLKSIKAHQVIGKIERRNP
jgi:SAM-dependent methyltransferase